MAPPAGRRCACRMRSRCFRRLALVKLSSPSWKSAWFGAVPEPPRDHREAPPTGAEGREKWKWSTDQ
eukprot:Skav212778  [mRNA]  locus=scaffold159:202310:202510:+ [translate_table: standard]